MSEDLGLDQLTDAIANSEHGAEFERRKRLRAIAQYVEHVIAMRGAAIVPCSTVAIECARPSTGYSSAEEALAIMQLVDQAAEWRHEQGHPPTAGVSVDVHPMLLSGRIMRTARQLDPNLTLVPRR